MTDGNTEQKNEVPPLYPYASVPDVGHSLDVVEIWNLLRSNRRLILKVTLVTTLLATIASFLITPKYQGEVTFALVTPQAEHGGLSSLLSKFGGLASLAGISGLSLPGAADSDSAIATLTSRKTLLSYVKIHNLKPILFSRRWDSDTKKWKIGKITRWLKSLMDMPLDQNPAEHLAPGEPTGDQTYKLLSKKIVSVEQDTKSSLLTLNVVWKDPVQAAVWANGLIAYANSELRKRDINDSERMITYLTEQANRTDNPDIRTALYQMIENQEQTVAIATSTMDYAFRIINPAVPADLDNYVKPKRVLMIILGFIGGIFSGGLYVLLKKAVADSKRILDEGQ